MRFAESAFPLELIANICVSGPRGEANAWHFLCARTNEPVVQRLKDVQDEYRELTMNPVYEERLIGAFSSIYQALEPRFPGGERFECGDGWYGIVQELSAELEAISRLHGANRLKVVQVKEKLAALRVYFDMPAPATAIRLVDTAIERSRVTCELCGAPGNLRRYREGWLKTLCEKCAPQAQAEVQA